MNPTAFSIVGFDIRWYGILIATGMILGILIANYNCKWREVDYDNLLNIVLTFYSNWYCRCKTILCSI